MRVGIVGLGLMGGSFGLALKKSMSDVRTIGFDHNAVHCEDAFKYALVDEIVSFSEIKSADIIILAIPVEGVIATLELLKDIAPDDDYRFR